VKRRLARVLIFAYWTWLTLLALDALAISLVWNFGSTDSSATLAFALAFYFLIGVLIAFFLWLSAQWAQTYLDDHA